MGLVDNKDVGVLLDLLEFLGEIGFLTRFAKKVRVVVDG